MILTNLPIDGIDVRRVRPEDLAPLEAFRYRLPSGLCRELELRSADEVLKSDRAGTVASFLAVLPSGRVVGYASLESGVGGTARAVRPVFDPEQHSLGLELRMWEAVELEAAVRGEECRWTASSADSRARLRFVLISLSLGPAFLAMAVGIALLRLRLPEGKLAVLMWLFPVVGALCGLLLPVVILTKVRRVLLPGERALTLGLAPFAWVGTVALVGLFWAVLQQHGAGR